MCTPATSNGGLLTINANPVITLQPGNVTLCEDGTTQFAVTATGTGLTYQWRENGSNITNGGIYSGATTSTLTLTGVTSAMSANTYSVVVTGTCTNVTSSNGILTIQEKPEITAHPGPQTICQGGNTTFTVNAGVTTTPTYQWQVSTNSGVSYTTVSNGGIYSGATTATLTLTAAPLANNGFLYRAVVSGVCAPPATSNGGLLTFNANPVINASTQANVTLREDGTTQL